MRSARRWLSPLAVIALAAAIYVIVVRAADPDRGARAPAAIRPAAPPRPGDPKPAAPREPILPTLSPAERAELAERVRGRDRPGEHAFRAVAERYVDGNLELAQDQAASEGLTLAEVRELTYFGLMVLATQRTSEVEDLIGRPLTGDERGALADLMQHANGEFRKAMRALVARKASEAVRWALIRDTERRYRDDLFRVTSLTDALLDDLLAGNIALPGAPGHDDLATGAPAGTPHDPVTSAARPAHP
jgi:hypothetical protein